MKQFIIHYTVKIYTIETWSNAVEYKRDVALVCANNEDSAKKELTMFIEKYSTATISFTIAKFDLIREYNGSVFTRYFRQDEYLH